MSLRAVSFDLDGTLYARSGLEAAIRGLVGSRWREPLRSWRELRALSRARAAFERARRGGGDTTGLELPAPRATLAALERRWYVAGLARAGPRPGLPALLDDLARRGLRLALVTDHPAEAKLEALGLAGRFQVVVVGEALGKLKPAPEPLLAACRELGVEPAQLLHVGDRAETDGESARRAGCAVHLVSPSGPIDLGGVLEPPGGATG